VFRRYTYGSSYIHTGGRCRNDTGFGAGVPAISIQPRLTGASGVLGRLPTARPSQQSARPNRQDVFVRRPRSELMAWLY